MVRVARGWWIALLMLVVPTCALLAYDWVVVHPRLPQVRAIVAQADAEDRHPPALMGRLLRAAHPRTTSPAGGYVTMQVLARLDAFHGSSTIHRHARTLLWQWLLSWHLTDDEWLALYSTLASNGVDQGLNRLALREFGRPLGRLSEREAAHVVAITHAPGLYLHDRKALARRGDMLLQRLQQTPP